MKPQNLSSKLTVCLAVYFVKLAIGVSVALLIPAELDVVRLKAPSVPLMKAAALLSMMTKGCDEDVRWKV